MDISDYALQLEYKTKSLETVDSFKLRRNFRGSIDVDMDLIPRYHDYSIRHENQLLEVNQGEIPELLVESKFVQRESSLVEKESLEIPVCDNEFKPRDSDSKLKKQAPLLYAAKSLIEGNDGKRIVDQLIKLVHERNKKSAKEPIKKAPKQVFRDTMREEKIRLETVAVVEELVNNTKMDRTENILERIKVSTSSTHPAAIKKMFQDCESKSRAARSIPTNTEVLQYFAQPPGTRTKEALIRINDFLYTFNVFKNKPAYVIDQLCDALLLETHAKGSTLFRQGDPGIKYYFIFQGSVLLTVTKPGYVFTDPDAPQNPIAVMKANEAFGDHALLNNLNRSTSAFANEEHTLLLTIDKDTFVRCMSVSYQVQVKDRKKFLKNYAFTAQVDTKGLIAIAQKLFPREYAPGAVIMRENEISESVYFIRKGRCAVYRQVDLGDRKRQIYMGEMDHRNTFNEECVLKKSMSRKGLAFTVVAITKVEVVSIVSQGEWTSLNLQYSPSPFIKWTNQDLICHYNRLQHEKKFKQYKNTYIKQLKRI